MKKLEGIFFDVDDTLYSCTEFANKARANACKAMISAGLKYPFERLYDELQEVINEFTSNYEQHFDKLLLRLPPTALENCTPSLIVAAAIVAYHNTKHREMFPYEDAIDLLTRLKRIPNFVTGIITAGITVKQAEKVVRLGLPQYVTRNAVFITEEVGITKRNPRLYLSACNRFNLSPDNVMYVGDNPELDIDVPNSIGMITVLHKRSGKYANSVGETKPHFVIDNYYDLMDILADGFGLPIYTSGGGK